MYEHQGAISAVFFYVGRATRNTIINPRDETKTQGVVARTGAPSGRISNPLGPNYHKLFSVSLFYLWISPKCQTFPLATTDLVSLFYSNLS